MQKGTAIAVPFLCFSGKGLWAAWAALAVRFFVFARFFCLFHAYLSLLQATRPPFFSFGDELQRSLRGCGRAVSFISAFAPFLRPTLDCKLSLPLSSFHKKKKAATR